MSSRKRLAIRIAGCGHSVGERTVSNEDLARSLRLEPNWFESRTGIRTRRAPGSEQTVTSMAAVAIREACMDAGVSLDAIGPETLLLHIQNGMTHLTPPSGILLCASLGLSRVRTLTIDGACSEPIAALEIAAHMLNSGVCKRAILSAASDFLPMIDPTDLGTVGLFGSGAGAVILDNGNGAVGEIRSIKWESRPEYYELGIARINGHTRDDSGVTICVGFYEMQGPRLAKTALRILPHIVAELLGEAGWTVADLDYVVSHQPSAKLMEIGAHHIGLPLELMDTPVTEYGNMGPATVLVGLSLAKQRQRITTGSRVLLISFGIGFSYGGAALVL